MTTEPEKPPEAPPEPESDKTGIIQTIRDEIASTLGKLFETGKADVKDGEAGGDPAPGKGREDVASEVKREVAKLRADEQKQAEQKSMAERIAELEAAIKKGAESVPEEFRWITEKMWR